MKKLWLLALPIILFSCSSSDDDQPTVIVPINPSGDAYSYARGDMDGAAFNYTFNTNDIMGTVMYGPITSVSSLDSDRWFSYGGMFSPISNMDKFLYVSFSNIYNGSYEDESAQFHTAFATVPSNYITFAQDDNRVRGFEVGYQAAENQNYSTMGGSQTGSTCVILSAVDGTESGIKIKTITGTFSCKLYNQDDATDVINVTNGTFKVVVSEDH